MQVIPQTEVPQVEVDVLDEIIVKTKKHGDIKIYAIKPNENYQMLFLRMFALNNPRHFYFNPELECFYVNDYSLVYLQYIMNERFYTFFLAATMKRSDGQSHYDTSMKVLKAYANKHVK